MAPPNPGPGSIYSRNKSDCIEAAAQLFRTLCDDSSRRKKSLNKLTTEDFILAGLDPYLATNTPSSPESDSTGDRGQIYSMNTDTKAKDFLLDEFVPWTAYRMHDEPEFVEIDMMSSALTYRATVWRKGEDGQMNEVETVCTSVWKQGAGAEWKCCLHHMSRV